MTCALLAAAFFGRQFVPPAPLAMTETAVGHGTAGSYECLPGSSTRCACRSSTACAVARSSGARRHQEEVVHVWKHAATRSRASRRRACTATGRRRLSQLLPCEVAATDPTGAWRASPKRSAASSSACAGSTCSRPRAARRARRGSGPGAQRRSGSAAAGRERQREARRRRAHRRDARRLSPVRSGTRGSLQAERSALRGRRTRARPRGRPTYAASSRRGADERRHAAAPFAFAFDEKSASSTPARPMSATFFFCW